MTSGTSTSQPVRSNLTLVFLLLSSGFRVASSVPTLSFVDTGSHISQTRPNRETNPDLLKLTKPHTTLHRVLNSGSNDFSSLLVDSNGNEYEPYSLAWRYLGIYMDCDAGAYRETYSSYNGYSGNNGNSGSASSGQYYVYDDDGMDDDVDAEEMMGWYRRRDRRLGGSGDDGNDCTRKVLWAAYHDPRYRGGQIGEYQFYDFTTGDYSKEFCTNTNFLTGRCARMDCHESNTGMKLVGIYKESDGLMDWAEQLFKHQGYCLWSQDTYEFMEKYYDFWPSYCRELYYTGDDGSPLYMDLQPTPGGNISVGVYSDDLCSTPSSYTFGDYIMMYYSYYGYYDKGAEVVETWQSALDQWNEYMNIYKICQPCRAYSLNVDLDGDSHSGSRSQDENENRMRFLGEDNDGEGEEEKSGYNCYDDAGYTNCNQCYKFESQTDLSEASIDDLKRAHKQGTILAIRFNGQTFGKGGFRGPPKFSFLGLVVGVFYAACAVAFLISVAYILRVTPLLDIICEHCRNHSRLLLTFLYWLRDKWVKWRRKRFAAEKRPPIESKKGRRRYRPPGTNKDKAESSPEQAKSDDSTATFHTAESQKETTPVVDEDKCLPIPETVTSFSDVGADAEAGVSPLVDSTLDVSTTTFHTSESQKETTPVVDEDKFLPIPETVTSFSDLDAATEAGTSQVLDIALEATKVMQQLSDLEETKEMQQLSNLDDDEVMADKNVEAVSPKDNSASNDEEAMAGEAFAHVLELARIFTGAKDSDFNAAEEEEHSGSSPRNDDKKEDGNAASGIESSGTTNEAQAAPERDIATMGPMNEDKNHNNDENSGDSSFVSADDRDVNDDASGSGRYAFV